jgi:hypothetical protein
MFYFTGNWMDINLCMMRIIHIQLTCVINYYVNRVTWRHYCMYVGGGICFPVMCIMFTTWKWLHPSLSLRTQRNLKTHVVGYNHAPLVFVVKPSVLRVWRYSSAYVEGGVHLSVMCIVYYHSRMAAPCFLSLTTDLRSIMMFIFVCTVQVLWCNCLCWYNPIFIYCCHHMYKMESWVQ